MDDIQARLARCFRAVFPSLTDATVMKADATNTEGWDSVASVTLFAAVEEEFEIPIDFQDSTALFSFAGLLEYLTARTAPK